MMTVPTIFLLGPQGSGKGTQAKLLAKKYGLRIIETGQLLRNEAGRTKQTKRSRTVGRYTSAGKLVPSAIVVDVLFDAFRKIPKSAGLLFDGSPRTLPEARKLIRYLRKHGRTVTHMFLLELSRKESIRRLLLRNRSDDTPKAIVERLRAYKRSTTPVLRYAKKTIPSFRISGEQSIPAVFRDVDAAYRKGLRR